MALPVSGSCTLRFVAVTVGVFVTVAHETAGSEVAASRMKPVADSGYEKITFARKESCSVAPAPLAQGSIGKRKTVPLRRRKSRRVARPGSDKTC